MQTSARAKRQTIMMKYANRVEKRKPTMRVYAEFMMPYEDFSLFSRRSPWRLVFVSMIYGGDKIVG